MNWDFHAESRIVYCWFLRILLLHLFFIKYLYDVMAAIYFLHLSVDFTEVFLLSAEVLLGTFHDHGNETDGKRKY